MKKDLQLENVEKQEQHFQFKNIKFIRVYSLFIIHFTRLVLDKNKKRLYNSQRKSKLENGDESLKLSDLIEEYIKDIIKECDEIELKRSDLASKFNCVPSQINYVISTRFAPEMGFYVESRRGRWRIYKNCES